MNAVVSPDSSELNRVPSPHVENPTNVDPQPVFRSGEDAQQEFEEKTGRNLDNPTLVAEQIRHKTLIGRFIAKLKRTNPI